MNEPCWINKQALLLLHASGLAEHGGLAGLRDETLLDSALARPENLLAYGAEVDIAALAASYAFGLAKNHPFNDGNKRVAFLALGLFLDLNGFSLEVGQVEATEVVLKLAAGDMTEEAVAAWIRRNSAPTT